MGILSTCREPLLHYFTPRFTARVAGAVAPDTALGQPRTEAGGCKEARNGVLGVRRAPKLSYIGPQGGTRADYLNP